MTRSALAMTWSGVSKYHEDVSDLKKITMELVANLFLLGCEARTLIGAFVGFWLAAQAVPCVGQ